MLGRTSCSKVMQRSCILGCQSCSTHASRLNTNVTVVSRHPCCRGKDVRPYPRAPSTVAEAVNWLSSLTAGGGLPGLMLVTLRPEAKGTAGKVEKLSPDTYRGRKGEQGTSAKSELGY
jgi:hypothetical protein